MNTVPTLEESLDFIRKSSAVELLSFICGLSLESDSRLPSDFLSSLEDTDKIFCWRAILVCYMVSQGQQIPREMQLRAVLADHHGLDCLIAAGTGSGKTLPTALKILLDDPADALITITLSPLKRLQVTQENDFNSKYGISTVVINEDTPRDDAWWEVSFKLFYFSFSSLKDCERKDGAWCFGRTAI
jgi:RAD3-like DEAD/DEAH box helicase